MSVHKPRLFIDYCTTVAGMTLFGLGRPAQALLCRLICTHYIPCTQWFVLSFLFFLSSLLVGVLSGLWMLFRSSVDTIDILEGVKPEHNMIIYSWATNTTSLKYSRILESP